MNVLSVGPRRADLVAALVTLALVVAVVVPVVARVATSQADERARAEQTTCLSNQKQMGTATMMYAQDYDELYPLAQGRTRVNGQVQAQNWGPDTRTASGAVVPGLLSPYLKNNAVFRCPAVRTNNGPLTYMLSDLIAGASLATLATPAYTIAIAEGEDLVPNVGHAYVPDQPPVRARFSVKTGRVLPSSGARVQTAPVRHQGGATYAFADGHAKWMTPVRVFFPPRASASPDHVEKGQKTTAPDPAQLGSASRTGSGYAATFHLR